MPLIRFTMSKGIQKGNNFVISPYFPNLSAMPPPPPPPDPPSSGSISLPVSGSINFPVLGSMSSPVSGSITFPVLGLIIGQYAGFFSLFLSLSGFSDFSVSSVPPGFSGVLGLKGIIPGIKSGFSSGSFFGFSPGLIIRHSSGIAGL